MAHLVTAIIKPFKLEEVKEALRDAGVLGPHRQRGPGLRPPGRQDRDVPGLGVQGRLRAQGPDRGPGRLSRSVDKVIDADRQAARTGKIGDGKIWADRARRASMRVRTGEMGDDAL